MELHRVSVKRAPVAETRKGAGAGTPETGVATKADVPCLKAPLRHRASRPVCAKVTANAQHPKSGWQKYEKLHHSQAVTKALGKMPACPAEKRGLLFNFKMKEKMKKDKLLEEFATLKIEDANTIVGGQESWKWTYQESWTKTNGPTGKPGDWHMDKETLRFKDPDLKIPTDTISRDTITQVY